MDQETIEDEITNTGNRKTVLGVRCYPELKFKLSEEAEKLGISLSECAENILLNKDALLSEKEDAISEVEILKNKCLRLEEMLISKDAIISSKQNHFNNEYQKLNTENTKLKLEVDLMKKQFELFSNKHLLFLFEKLKDKKDTIISPNGNTYNVTYSHPKDLLEAMIHSFKIKKP
ncbi:MAG: hypothetical protein Q7W45_10750 [Bacteroidota bacterium]|nr:hypothetical protein [Bacteroidota bacterium]MDP3146066.1 hypothetical protein [Bacteroidota bacterium]